MARIIRLTENDLSRIVRRVIREQEVPPAPDSTIPTPYEELPNCQFKGNTNMLGTGFEMSGAYTKITTNGSVAPQYQGYTVHTVDGPFCFIPRN